MQNFLRRLFGQKRSIVETVQQSAAPEEVFNPAPVPAEAPTVHQEIIVDQSVSDTAEEVPTHLLPYDTRLDLRDYQYPPLQLLSEELRPLFNSLQETAFTLPIIWSVNSTGIQVRDLMDLQSILIAGVPASGKSNLLQQFLLTLLYKKHPSQIKFVLLDYKGLDLSFYQAIEKHFLAKLPGQESAIVTDTTLAAQTLNALCIEMDNRYDLLRDAGVKEVKTYNAKFIQRQLSPTKGHQFLPFIILIIDNVEGFITRQEKEISPALQRLVTVGYKEGIFVVLTTSDLHYKALPTELLRLVGERIAFRLNSKEEYRKLYETSSVAISYEAGAFHYAYQGKVHAGRSMYIPSEYIQSLVNFISSQPAYPGSFLLQGFVDEHEPVAQNFDTSEFDSLFEDAARLIVQNQISSISLLQRRMKLGYNWAGRLMTQLEAAGIVGPDQGSKARGID